MADASYISASRLSCFGQCPRKYFFRYVVQAPPQWRSAALAFGSAIHGALEMFHKACLRGEIMSAEDVVRVFEADWAAQQEEALKFKDDEDPAALVNMAGPLIHQYVAQMAESKVIAVEHEFQVPLADDVTGEVLGPDLYGVFDLVLAGDQLVEIKTAARAYDAGTLERLVQLSAYGYAYRRMFGRDPRIVVIALLKKKWPKIESYEVSRTVEDDRWFVHAAAEVSRAIGLGAFPPNRGWWCDDCEYGSACAAWPRTSAP